MANDRGDYSALYRSFWDDEDVHRMSDAAYRVLTTLKGTLPPSGIGVVYASQLAERCGKSSGDIEAALVELETPKPGARLGWIVRDRKGSSKCVAWIVNGLRFEPTLSSKNAKHRTYVRERNLAPLGMGSDIVAAFVRHYPEWFPANVPHSTPVDDSDIGIPEDQDRVSEDAGNNIPSHPIPDHTGIDNDSAPTPVAIVRAIHDASTERWGEQPHPVVTMGAASMLSAAVAAKGIPMSVARDSIYRQCRVSKELRPYGSANYFLPGIEQDWGTEQTRRKLAEHPAPIRPPPPIAPRGRTARPSGTPTAPTNPDELPKWT